MLNVFAILGLAVMQSAAPDQSTIEAPNSVAEASPTAVSQASAPDTNGDARVRIPFNPPRDTPLPYRILIEQTDKSGAQLVFAVEQSLTYADLSDGDLELSIETPSITRNGHTFAAGGDLERLPEPNFATVLSGVVNVRVRPDGQPVRVENWEAVRANFERAVDIALAATLNDAENEAFRDPGVADFARRSAREAVAGMTAEKLVKPLLGVWSNVLGFSQMFLEPGE